MHPTLFRSLPLFVFLIASLLPAAENNLPKTQKLTPAPFTAVKVDDAFWSPRIETNRTKSLPHNFQWCEETGRFDNFAKAGGLMEGEFRGAYFNDSDVYKVIEGASYSLAAHPDPKLEEKVDEIIAKIAAAQQNDGYLNSYFTLVAPDKKWTNFEDMHELYCAGHLFEAAVAHHRATGKRTLLDVALKFADHIDNRFGPGKRIEVPGHEEIELALVKLHGLSGEKRYLDLAAFFLETRGDASKRTLFGKRYRAALYQDHMPVVKQSEIVGHAVRAMYLMCGVADVAAITGNQGFIDAMDRLWQSTTQHKMYISGGIGARHGGEEFGNDYELPNETAYCETCAAIGMLFWNQRMNLMYADVKYMDVFERTLYNGFLSGVGLDGKKFFYVNPLESKGNHHRQPFFDCACCPTNVVRFLPSLPGYIYAAKDDAVFVNLYISGRGKIDVAGDPVEIVQETRYPWDGKIKITLAAEKPREFSLNLRMPDWCDNPEIALNGEKIAQPQVEKGYAQLRRTWQSGDTVELNLPMDVKRIEANPQVEADRGRVAVQRGPVVYCFEAADNSLDGKSFVNNIVLPRDPKFSAEFRPDLLGGVTVVTGADSAGRKITAVPYHVWDHRTPGEMAVWVQQEGKSAEPKTDDPAWEGKLYRPLDVETLAP